MDREKSPEDIAPEDWPSVDTAPIVPGKPPVGVAAPPSSQALPPALGSYFAGSLSSDIQHDGLFVKTGYQTQSAERTPLMPVGPAGNAQNNVVSQTVVVNQGGTTVITGLDFRGTWNAFTNYKPDDIVQYVGNLYICTSANTNLTPNTNPSFWTLFAQQSAVTSVALTMPSIFAVAGSPGTSAVALAVTLATQTANTIFAGPSAGLAAIPTFRVLVTADIPNLPASIITSGQLALARGGTNADLSATGGTSQVLKQVSSGAAITVGQLAASDLSNGTIGSGKVQLVPEVVVNTTPVSKNANTTGDQDLMSNTLLANSLNSVGRTLHVWGSGLYSSVSAVTSMTVKVWLGSLLVVYWTTGNPPVATDHSWNFNAWFTTTTAGASGAFEAHGSLRIDLNNNPGQEDSTYTDVNTTTVGTADTTGTLALKVTMSFDSADAGNIATQRQMIGTFWN